MRKTLSIIGLTAAFVVILDVMVAMALSWAADTGRLGSLVQYFEYGRSVPGKLSQWEDNPGARGNLYDVAWRDDMVEGSLRAFDSEDTGQGPVLRSYGMSFVNNIIQQAVALDPGLIWDSHAGPGAPPNYTFALFQDDRAARRPGDIAVLGILSSSVSGMAALSNSTWVFEQPAPFTYPVFQTQGEELTRVEPLVSSASQLRDLSDAGRAAWQEQLDQQDYFYGMHAFGLTWFDRSPFVRLVRRSLATSVIDDKKAQIIAGAYPYEEVLQRMVAEFAQTARADGQLPLVMLIQSRNPTDPDVLELVRPVIEGEQIPYLATSELFDPRDPSGFAGDGHYLKSIDRRFAQELLRVLDRS